MAAFCCAVAQNALGNVAGNLVGRILKLTSNPIILVFKMKANVDNLKKQVAELKEEKERVEHYAQAAERRGEEIEQKLKNWLNGAGKFIEAAEKIEDNEENAKKKCFFGMCLNPLSRYKLSKKAVEDSMDIADLVRRARGFDLQLSYLPTPRRAVAVPVKDFQEFESRMDVLAEIMTVLQSPNIKIIGLHGMPGVGKTMLLKEVKRKAEEEKLFDAVVMASVTKSLELRKIQDKIAFDLDLELPLGMETWRAASQIKEKFRKKKKVLLILDDIWARLDLEEVGIPIENQQKMNVEISSSAEGHMKCKILLASRDRYVLSTEMGCEKEFAVGKLRHQEPWHMFKMIVGERAESHELQRTAIEIVEECGGLPIAIATLENALRSKSLPEWRDALTKLRNPSPNNFTSISATRSVYTAIEVSYTHLGSDLLKQTFLLASFMGPNALIQDLLKYGVGLSLFSQSNTIEEARNAVLTLISNLKASSLLIDGSDSRHFDVHDVIRDVALSIARRDRHGWFLEDDHVPTRWSDKESVKDFKWLCLDVTIDELPDELESPQLTFFWLFNKNPSLEIPANFFRGMQRLQVLDLTLMRSSLPSSICFLKNLRTLCLDHGVLGDIHIIGELKNLEILSFWRSDIKKLPREIGQLTRLRLLDLSGCTKLKVIMPRVLASMSRLEELYLGNSFNRWEHDEHENPQNATLAELKHLKKLTALEVHIRDAKMIPGELFFEKLKSYRIFIGDALNKWDSSSERSRILKLQLRASISSDFSLKQLLKMTEELHLEELQGVKNILYELDSEGFQELKYLYVQNALTVQHIINSVVFHNAFPILEVLSIRNLINLEKICYGRLRGTSFCRLRIITVECCNQLKMLLSFSTFRQLLQLQEIGVADCRNMVEIVDKEGKEDAGDNVEATDQMVELGQLHSLRLQNLPKFISFSQENDTSLSHVPLLSEKIKFTRLEFLSMSLNIQQIWHNRLLEMPSFVRKLKELTVDSCGNLRYLLTCSTVKSFEHVESLKICHCKMMERVIVAAEEKGTQRMLFPNLQALILEDLPKLTAFCPGNCIEFPNLTQLHMVACPLLETFTSSRVIGNIAVGSEKEENTYTPPLFDEKVILYYIYFFN
ncbi:hypothetical protein SLA2020_106880 [Shorea laevis]